MFNPRIFENSRPDGIAVLEIVNGTDPQEREQRQFVPLKRTELAGEVDGPLASLRLIHTYGYTRDQCEKVLEAVYRFPLPGDAAVTGVRVSFGDVEIQADLKERRKAEETYQEARREGRQAALATRESADVFTLQVAGIQPDQDVIVETSYIQLARPEGLGWSLRVPLTTSPRYVRSDEAASRPAAGQPLLLLRDPGHRFSLDLSLPGAGSVESATHGLELMQDDEGVSVRLRDGEVIPDRDCVLSWRPQQERDRPALQVLHHRDQASGQVYFLALLVPPEVREPNSGVPREVTLLVDQSGSMEGAKWEAANWAVKSFLSDLAEGDSFALGLFHSTTRWFANAPRKADAKSVEEAIRFLEAQGPTGGTELGVALEQALSLARSPGEAARHLLIVTDAEVTDAGRILRLANEESERPDRRRISVLCIDAAPNSFLASELADRGGGVAKFLTSAPAEEDISTALDQVLADWAAPVLAGLQLAVSRLGPGVQTAGGRVLEPGDGRGLIDLGDLPAGRPVWVAGRVPHGDASDLAFRVIDAGGREVASHRLYLAQEAVERPALKALFGARRVLGLEFLINSGYRGDELKDQLQRLGYDPDAIPTGQSEMPPELLHGTVECSNPACGATIMQGFKFCSNCGTRVVGAEEAAAGQAGIPPRVYAENVRADAIRTLRDLLVAEALDYGLACSETAFVAVRMESGHPIEGTVPVASALPSGWSDRFETGVTLTSGALHNISTGAAAPTMRLSTMSTMEIGEGAGADIDAMERMIQMADVQPAAPRQGDPAEAAQPGVRASTPLFSGVPQFTAGEAVLFDSTRQEDAAKLPGQGTIRRLEVRFPAGTPAQEELDAGLVLLLFVDDLASPRARVRLADVVRQGGSRPLNLARPTGQPVRIVLLDPAGAWSQGAPQIEVALAW